MRIILLTVLVFISNFAISQNGFHVVPTYRKATTQSVIQNASKISDINTGFPSSWIEKYQNVELKSIYKGDTITNFGNNNFLSSEQITLLKNSQLGTQLYFKIDYLPKGVTDNKMARRIEFNYTVAPETVASYDGGFNALEEYLLKKELDKKASLINKEGKECIIHFKINNEGEPYNIQMESSSGDHHLDENLKEVLRNMKRWKPAIDIHGINVPQEFRLHVGLQDC